MLIKDNHLAFGARHMGADTPGDAVRKSREFLAGVLGTDAADQFIIEVEVDTLDQLRQVLPQRPDIVLLDNMSAEVIHEAVALRDAAAEESGFRADLEASGGIDLSTVRGIAEAGVDRISVGALTHSAVNLDVGLDWLA